MGLSGSSGCGNDSPRYGHARSAKIAKPYVVPVEAFVPTVLIEGYKFRFYSSDFSEPPHVHVLRGERQAKIWLAPIALVYNHGFNTSELNRILRLTDQNRARLLEVWHEYFSH
jgi:hypothetical protein